MTKLRVYKTHPEVPFPKFGTEQAACFDLNFSCIGKNSYDGFDRTNKPFKRPMHGGTNIFINPFDRILVPTGLIFDIPVGFSVRIHSRSGIAFSRGLTLANSEGVIDSDYVNEVSLMFVNLTDTGQWIYNGDRMAQGEMIRTTNYELVQIDYKPKLKANRVGGLGSTGITEIKSTTEEKKLDNPA